MDAKLGCTHSPMLIKVDPRKNVNNRPRKAHRLFRSLLLISAAAGTFYFQLLPVFSRTSAPATLSPKPTSDPSTEWKDDIWPIRQPSPWDISTDFPYPRTLEYDVQEGTWLRLDVHPVTSDIVFDMAGDIFCIPGNKYRHTNSGSIARAHPILLGVPHDSDPHFSPQGDSIVFRSDAELGVENIWIMKWTGCENMNVRPVQVEQGPLMDALELKAVEDNLLASGVKETSERKTRRLIREGRLEGGSSFVVIP